MGVKVYSDITEYKCSICGEINSEDKKYCTNCGHWLLDTNYGSEEVKNKKRRIIKNLKEFFTNKEEIDPRIKFTLENTQAYVEETINDLIQTAVDDRGSNVAEYEKKLNRRKILINVTKNCGLGDMGAKLYTKSFILDLITQSYGVNKSNIDMVFDFVNPKTVQDKFEIILYAYKKIYKFKALETLIEKYNLNKYIVVEGEKQYAITEEHINNIFEQEEIVLSYEDKLEIITQRIYQNYKGLGVIDEIRDQEINGLSGGISGVPVSFVGKIREYEIKQEVELLSKYRLSYDSIWLNFKGKEIYLQFLGFGSQRELERICRIIYKFNNPRQFSRADGYILSSMADLTRVAVFRPPLAEGWAFWMRKFDVNGDLDELIKGENCDLVKSTLDFLAKSKQNLIISGQQNTGKTTLLVAIVKKMYADVTLRLYEDFFEAHLRLLLPHRNIFTIRKIESIQGEEGLNALKKSNGQITIISEAADDIAINYLVKVALVASEAMLTTYHNETPDDLVESFRNAAINAGGFSDENIAEKQVLNILGFEPHLTFLPDKTRIVERITEFIRLDDRPLPQEYKNETDIVKKQDLYADTAREFMERTTGAKKYKAVNIIEYDFERKKYVVKNKISDKRKKAILERLHDEDKVKFNEFIKQMESMIEIESEV